MLVGDGLLRQQLEAKTVAANLSHAVIFAGNSNNVPLMLSQMDVFVLPSLAEGISNTILEAMASGLPVIASKVGGNPELILPAHQLSHLFESNNVGQLADCMALYIKNPERYQEDSALVKKHCHNNFSLDSMVQTLSSAVSVSQEQGSYLTCVESLAFISQLANNSRMQLYYVR